MVKQGRVWEEKLTFYLYSFEPFGSFACVSYKKINEVLKN